MAVVSTSGDSTGGIAPCAAVNRLFYGPSPGVTGARWKGKWTSGYKRPQSQQRWKAEGALARRGSLFNYFYISGLIGLEQPALDCGNHSESSGLTGIIDFIGLEWPALQGPSER